MSLVGLLFTSSIPTIDHMNLPTFLIGFPVGFISDTYFPVVTRHAWLAALVALNPVHHCAEAMRALLVSGTVDDHAIWLVVECLDHRRRALPHRRAPVPSACAWGKVQPIFTAASQSQRKLRRDLLNAARRAALHRAKQHFSPRRSVGMVPPHVVELAALRP